MYVACFNSYYYFNSQIARTVTFLDRLQVEFTVIQEEQLAQWYAITSILLNSFYLALNFSYGHQHLLFSSHLTVLFLSFLLHLLLLHVDCLCCQYVKYNLIQNKWMRRGTQQLSMPTNPFHYLSVSFYHHSLNPFERKREKKKSSSSFPCHLRMRPLVYHSKLKTMREWVRETESVFIRNRERDGMCEKERKREREK